MDSPDTSPAPLAPANGRLQLGRLLRQRGAREWGMLLLLWLTAVLYAGHAIWAARTATIERDLERLQSQAEAVELNLTRQLRSVSDALASVHTLLNADNHATDIATVSAQLQLLGNAMPGVGTLQLLDVDGKVIAASRADLVGQNFRQRTYFLLARNDTEGAGLYVSPPFFSTLGRTTTVFARPLRGPDGLVTGVLTASLNPEYFELVLRAALYAPDARATVVHGNGQIIVSSPLADSRPGYNLNVPGSMFERHMQSGRSSTVQHGLRVGTGEYRMMAMRTIAVPALRLNQPLVVRMSRLSDAVLASWRAETRNELLLLLAAMAASGIWLRWHQRRRGLQEQTERAAARAERRSARRLEFGLRGADLGLWELNLADGTVSVNAREMEMLGLAPTTDPLAPAFWRELVHPDDAGPLARAAAAHLRGETPSYRLEHRRRHRDGHWIWVLCHAMVMERDARGRPLRVVGTHLDISERKRSQFELERMNAQLAALSMTDSLTGVANRRQFDQTLQAEWARGLRQHHPLALLMIDVDHFKPYNDQLGHPEGDACLRTVAQVLSSCLRHPVERLARYGGEEFAVLLVEAELHAGAAVARRCLDAIAAAALPHPASPLGPHLSLSMGVASVQPQPEFTPAHLVHAADAALYRAKQNGRACFELADDADLEARPTGMQPLAL